MPPVSWICANESGPAPGVGSRKLASDPFAAQTTGSFVEFTSGLNVARKSKLYPACVPPGPTVTPGPETKVGVPQPLQPNCSSTMSGLPWPPERRVVRLNVVVPGTSSFNDSVANVTPVGP